MAEVRHTFRPELLNRLDEIVVFQQLSPAALTGIARRMLDSLAQRLETLGIQLSVTDAAQTLLIRTAFDADYGARPLRRAIRAQIEDPAAELLLSGALPAGSLLTVDETGDRIVLRPSAAALPAG